MTMWLATPTAQFLLFNWSLDERENIKLLVVV